MDITDPLVIRFSNEQIRPMAEKLQRVKVDLDTILLWYSGQVQPLVAGNAVGDLLEDGRGPEGVSRLTLGDIQDLLSACTAIQAVLDGSGVEDAVSKPTVRMLQVQ